MSGNLISTSHRRFPGSTILKMTFGYSVAPEGQDPLIALANKASSAFVNAVNNLWAVDVFPFRKLSACLCMRDKFNCS